MIRALLLGLVCAGCSGTAASVPDNDRPVFMEMERLDGGRFRLASERGHVVLVNFFATWCVPCIAELPLLVKLQTRYRPDGFRVVAVSMDLGGRDVLRPFVEYMELNFPVLLADSRTFDGRGPFGPIHVLPTTFLVDRGGIAVGAHAGVLSANETEAAVRQLLDAH